MKNNSIASIATTMILVSIIVLTIPSYAVKPTPPVVDVPTLDPTTIPKFVNPLVKPPVYANTTIAGVDYYTVNMTRFTQQIIPQSTPNPVNPGQPFPETEVWGYGGVVKFPDGTEGFFRFAPGPTFEASRGTPISVTWQNFITSEHMFAVDPTLHWADPNNIGMMVPPPFPSYPPGFNGNSYTYPNGTLAPSAQSPVPLIPHLHGGEVHSTSDGQPEAWFTYNGRRGDAFNVTAVGTGNPNEARFYYPNQQPPTTLWYHDHALGITRINVMSGLAGFYLLRDPADTTPLPFGNYEYPIVIQDRSFNIDGSMWFPKIGLDPMVHPYWQPEFFGNTIMVNGKVWPNLDVEQALYRFRLLDGSNARFYTLWFQVKPGPLNPLLNPPPLMFYQIGTDGGYLPAPVPLTSLTIAPGERADIVVDFSTLFPGDMVIVRNRAKAPFPNGVSPDPKTVGTIMQFTVKSALTDPNQPTTIPGSLPSTIPTLTPTLGTPTKTLTLIEKMGMLGPTEIFLDGQKWMAEISEKPQVGSTQDWIIVNPTADTHPIHLHLVQFQLVSRQKFDVNKYLADWYAANNVLNPMTDLPFTSPTNNVGAPATGLAALAPYLKGKPTGPAANEMGWKDTIQMNPGEITIIRIRFAPLDYGLPGKPAYVPFTNQYPFDPTTGPGYVWHCHILDHEDNEMMRPYKVQP